MNLCCSVFRLAILLAPLALYSPLSGQVTGELRRWHKVTITVDGPAASETGSVNPFLDYRMDVTFINGSKTYVAPGYFAADGNAANSSANSGNKWRAHFIPDVEGMWTYRVSFRRGAAVAVATTSTAGTAISPDGLTGSFNVGPSDKTGSDFRGKGLLRYANKRYYKFAGTGELFLKGGADSPENFLAYNEFDGTVAKHRYDPHAMDWRTGDPAWQGTRGRNIIGALNYLAGQGMNSVYFLTMNVGGDGNDVWPWTASTERVRYDVSKLDQWEVVFSHMDRLGLMLHVVTQERENDRMLDGGALGQQRRLYYRELVARFGHHLALVWNLGEENTQTDAQRKEMAAHIRSIDPYDHPIVVHTSPGSLDTVYGPLIGNDNIDGPSLQLGDPATTYAETTKWIARSTQGGRPWVVTVDEIGPPDTGVAPDSVDPNHDSVRTRVLWPNLMAGGAGVEWYFGYVNRDGDLNTEDWRSRDRMWQQTRFALEFFRKLPFDTMTAASHLTANTADYCFAKAGQIYAAYLPGGGTTTIDLGTTATRYTVRWFNPRTGGSLVQGTVGTISGPGVKSIGLPPASTSSDWAVMIAADGSTPTTSHNLQVTNGTGDGIYPAGTSVTVTANTPLVGQVFSQWMGDIGHLSNPLSATTVLTMPVADASITATYSTSGSTSGTAVTSLTLMNADTNQAITTFNQIPDGAIIDVDTLPTRNISIRANTNPATVGSVRFSVNGTALRTESGAPYAIAGDMNGDYNAWAPPQGTVTIGATPYTGAGATGAAGQPLAIRVTFGKAPAATKYALQVTNGSGSGSYEAATRVTITAAAAPLGQVFAGWTGATQYLQSPSSTSTVLTMPAAATSVSATYRAVSQSSSGPQVTALTLINAVTNQPVAGFTNLTDGMTISLSKLPTSLLNIIASTTPAPVGSVRFSINDVHIRTENGLPYAIGGDMAGDHLAWTLPSGTFTLSVVAYTGSNLSGTSGPMYSVRLAVVP